MRRLGWVAASVAVTCAVAACGGSGGGSNGGRAVVAATHRPRTRRRLVRPTKGGEMVMAFQSDPDTFDPQVCYDATCWDNMEMLFNRLYDYNTNTTNLFAQAASAMPKVSDGGKRYTIPIRSGMKFANGKPVTAQDFVYTFSRICNPATKSPVVSFWDPVQGCSAFSKHPVGSVSRDSRRWAHTLAADHAHPARQRVQVRARDASGLGDPQRHRRAAGQASARLRAVHLRLVLAGSLDHHQAQPRLLGQIAAACRRCHRAPRCHPSGAAA